MNVFALWGEIEINRKQAEADIKAVEQQAAKSGKQMEASFERVTDAVTNMERGLKLLLKAFAALAAGKGLAGFISNVTKATGEIKKNSQSVGFSTRAYQQWDYVLKQFGTSMEQSANSLGNLAQRITAASEGSGEAAAMFDALGISVFDSTGRLKSQERVFEEVIYSLQQMEDVTLRNAIASGLFGRAAGDIIPILSMTNDELQRLKARAVVISDEDLDRAEEFRRGWEDIKTTFNSIITELGVQFLPSMQKALDWLAENLYKIPPIVEFIGDVFGIVFRYAGLMMEPVVDTIQKLFGEPWNFIVNVAEDVWDWLFNTTWAEKWEDIKGWIDATWNFAVNVGEGIAD